MSFFFSLLPLDNKSSIIFLYHFAYFIQQHQKCIIVAGKKYHRDREIEREEEIYAVNLYMNDVKLLRETIKKAMLASFLFHSAF